MTLTLPPGTGGSWRPSLSQGSHQSTQGSFEISARATSLKSSDSEKTKELFQRNAKMMQTEELATQLPTYGRRIKFTPERVQQIRNLVERGKSREEIAELIGVTVGSLQVTCSRLGISLRRVPLDNGMR